MGWLLFTFVFNDWKTRLLSQELFHINIIQYKITSFHPYR